MELSLDEKKAAVQATARTLAQDNTLYLQWSGGRDSQLLAEFLADMPEVKEGKITLVLLSVDTGDWPEETKERLAKWSEVPHVRVERITSNSLDYRAMFGDPFDIVVSTLQPNAPRVSHLQCCHANRAAPMNAHIVQKGYHTIIRGTRNADAVAWAREREVAQTYTIYNLLWDWTEDEVMAMLKDRPTFYDYGSHASVDCMSCTGWATHNTIGYVRAKNPALADAVCEKTRAAVQKVREVLGDYPAEMQ